MLSAGELLSVGVSKSGEEANEGTADFPIGVDQQAEVVHIVLFALAGSLYQLPREGPVRGGDRVRANGGSPVLRVIGHGGAGDGGLAQYEEDIVVTCVVVSSAHTQEEYVGTAGVIVVKCQLEVILHGVCVGDIHCTVDIPYSKLSELVSNVVEIASRWFSSSSGDGLLGAHRQLG